MATELLTSRPPLEEITIYWRTHDEHGRLPQSMQGWWVRLIDEDGGFTNEPFRVPCSSDWITMHEAVVAVAGAHGLTIGEEMVYRRRDGHAYTWEKGAWEAAQDDC